MLDLNHPQTRHIFAAARIEDEIRKFLVAWRKCEKGHGLSSAERTAIKQHIENLHALNASAFGASVGIAKTLNALSSSVSEGNAEASWEAFLNLAERQGDNFGTWAI